MAGNEIMPLVVQPHPFTPEGRTFTVAAFLQGETLGAYVERNGIVLPRSEFRVQHNGRVVPHHLWQRLIPRTGDQIVIHAIAQGGGGGGKVLRTVAMIALVVASITIPGSGIAGLYSGFGLTGTALSLTSAAIMIGGSLLINALLPPLQPTADALGSGAKYDSSPTYSISGGRNQLRLWEPMTLIFGRHKVVPDLGAKYFTEYVGDTQYLNQVFHFGLQSGQCVLSDLKIGATSINDYQDVQIQVSGEDGKLSMFPGNVDTLEGFVLESGVVNARTTPLDTTSISVDLAAQLFDINDQGAIGGMSVDVAVQYRKAGDTAWIDAGSITDAVYATHYWSFQERFTLYGDSNSWYEYQQIQYGSMNAADHTDGEEVVIEPAWCSTGDSPICKPERVGVWRWEPHPYRQGRPWRGIAPDPLLGYVTSPGVRIYGARQEPTRKTISWDVEKGQYEVRIWKSTGDIKESRRSNETAVSQVLCFQTDDADYTGQLRVALRIKATSQLNGAIDEFSAIAEAQAPVWKGDHFDIEHTRNPAWWYLWFAMGKTIEGKGRVYGAGLIEAQIDIEAIKAWGAWCDTKGLTFDYVLDRKMSSAQVLQMIARAGRASPTWQTGKLGVVWDAADQPVVAMFGPFNIKAGSFKVAYINDDTPDEIVVNFANEERDWQMDEVRVVVPGATTTNNPLQLDLDGCTVAEMAGREANLIAASQVWHRRRTTWETDIEGWVASRGDVVQISHDLTVWGYSGRLGARSGNQITLSQSIPTGSGTMMLRDPEGNMKTVVVTGAMDETDVVTITSDMTGFPLPGDEGFEDVPALDWAFFFDPLATPGRRFKIVDVQPTQDGVRFSAVDDDPEYYASEVNPYQYIPPRDGALLAGIVFGITVVEGIVNVLSDINSVQIGWALSAAMPVDVVIAINGAAQPAMRVVDRKMTIQAQTGDVLDITVTPVSDGGRSKPAMRNYTVQGLRAPLPAVTGLTSVFRDGLTVLTWGRVVDVRQPDYEIRVGESWTNSRTVAVTPVLESLTVGNGLYWVAARYVYKGQAIYGAPDSLLVSGAALVRNVLLTEVEDPEWGGALTEGAYVWDGLLTLAGAGDVLAEPDILAVRDVLWYGGAQPRGVYTSAQTVDIGFIAPVRLDFHIDAYALNFGEDILSMADVLANPDILNASNAQHWKATPQYRVAGDDGIYGPWFNYTPLLVNARYFQVRLVIEADDPLIVPFVEHFTWTVDVPDLIQKDEGITVPSSGLRIEYEKVFHAVPNVQIALFDAVDGDRYVLTNSSETGFDIQILNVSTPKAAVINWLSQGF
ncbi:MAG: host specificity protein J [Castellaniella sp.]|uniref:host specificity protein J n=1 Tax=Castellaniella sp. TaxID=1955812 RepID=UPI003A8BF84D